MNTNDNKERATVGTLRLAIEIHGPLSEEQALWHLHKLMDILEPLHDKNILHLNINPSNIMTTSDGDAFLVGFGAAKQYESNGDIEAFPTLPPPYVPLEVASPNLHPRTPASDIYSLGASFYFALTGIEPPNCVDLVSCNASLPPLPKSISPLLRNAIMEMMQLKPNKRPQSIASLRSLLPEKSETAPSFTNKPATPVAPTQTVVYSVFCKNPDCGKRFSMRNLPTGVSKVDCPYCSTKMHVRLKTGIRTLRSIIECEGPLPEKRALDYMRRLMDILESTHDKNMLHLNFKPDNILIDDNDQIHLSGLNLQKQPPYVPIEVTWCTPASDIYTLGAILYFALTGIEPPNCFDLATDRANLPPLPPSVSTTLRNAIKDMMQPNSKDRPQSIASLRHQIDTFLAPIRSDYAKCLATGQLLDNSRYRIVRLISCSDFEYMYEAENLPMGSRVIISEFFSDLYHDRGPEGAVNIGYTRMASSVYKLESKFCNLSYKLSLLKHPNIINTYELFCDKGTSYRVMDYVDGDSLQTIVKHKGPMPEERVIRYMRQIMDGLEYLHGKNIQHFDINPDNIIIGANDQAILVGYGISKYYDYSDDLIIHTSKIPPPPSSYVPVELVGDYPNRFAPAADIYSLGATFYFALTGIKPPNCIDLLTGCASLSPLPQSISTMLRTAIEEMLQPFPKERPQSIEAIKDKLTSDFTPCDIPFNIFPVPDNLWDGPNLPFESEKGDENN